MSSFELAEPHSLDEAFGLLDDKDPAIRPIGGGTALMLMIKSQLFKPVRLVSLRHLNGPFTGMSLNEDGAYLHIGAMTTFAEIEHSPVVNRHFAVVAQSMKALANVRVRNVATVGGNLAHGDPHLDLPPIWMALDAEATILNPSGERRIPVAQIFRGYYETTIADGELLAEICVPLRPGWRSIYIKETTRSAHDWPALGLAVSAELDNRRVKDLRIVLSAAVDRPTRLSAAEAVLRGASLNEAVLRCAADSAVGEVEMVSDSRGSAVYKQQLLRVHLARAIRAVAGVPEPW
jgi:aerobic carbon-monoxide dehydrogenase medium subunit